GEALDRWGPDAFRVFVLTSHYRTPATFSDEAMEAARSGAERLREAALAPSPAGPPLELPLEELRERFTAAMEDDLTTPRALAVLFELAREINRGRAEGRDTAAAQGLLRELAGVLGLTLQEPPRRRQDAAPFIDLLVEVRSTLRAAKQYALADRIRSRLAELGIELHDTPEGTTWRER
ncbi:MAG: DALR domain-containing protein, partial [Chloroflexota bacterium]|nr:DALR domain-containing protein [Chloroflexota bacterium]